jgi:hypothetical protein
LSALAPKLNEGFADANILNSFIETASPLDARAPTTNGKASRKAAISAQYRRWKHFRLSPQY